LLVFGPQSVEGEANYREALSLAAQPAVRAALVWRLAQNLIQSGQSGEALELCRASFADLSPSDGLLRAQLSTAQGWALLLMARYPEAEAAAQQALTLAEPFAGSAARAVDEVRARSHHVLGVAHSIRGLPDRALEHWQRTMEAARRAGLRQVENRCLMNIGMVLYQYHDDLAGARRYFNQALEQARALGDTYLIGRLLTNIGLTQHLSNDVEAAQETLAEAAELRRRMGELPGMANVENMRALVQLALGQVDEARARLERVMQETQHIGDQRVRSILVDTLAVANMVAGDQAAALAALQQEASLPGLSEDVKMRNELDSHLALARLASGDLAGARELLATAAPAAGGPECRFERELITGLVALAAGDSATAKAAAEAVAERADAIGYKLNAVAARRVLAALEAPPPTSEFPRLIWGAPR
jgi:tetratricopeptide (TPR) repeat protein